MDDFEEEKKLLFQEYKFFFTCSLIDRIMLHNIA